MGGVGGWKVLIIIFFNIATMEAYRRLQTKTTTCQSKSCIYQDSSLSKLQALIDLILSHDITEFLIDTRFEIYDQVNAL